MTYDLIIQIIKILLSNKTYISVSNIADKTNVSTKTIYNYLEKHSFLEHIYPCTLEKRQKQGVRILGNEQALNKLKQKLSIYEQEKNLYTPILNLDSTTFILHSLFSTSSSITIQSLAEKLYSNSVAISSILNKINLWLKNYDLQLSKKSNWGCQILGEEKNIRLAYKDFIIKSNYPIKTLKINTIDRLSDEHYRKLILIFDKQETDKVIQIISLAEIVLNNKFTDNDFYKLTVQILILIKRVRLGKFISYKLNNIENIPEFLAAQIIKNHIEDIIKFKIPNDELLALTQNILSARKQKEDTINSSKDEFITELTINRFVKRISDCLKINLLQDKTFINNLILHLVPAVRRSKYGTTAENPLLNKIRYEYTDIYLAVLTSIEELEVSEKIFLDANEIGYICLHVVAAINRCQKGGYIKVCLVCDNGITITNYLESTITRYLPEIKIIEKCTSSEFSNLKLANFDLILDSTNLIKNNDSKILKINEFLQKEEIHYIQNWILSKHLLDFNEDAPSIQGKIFYFHDDLPDRDSVLNKYGKYLFENGYVMKGYDKSLIAREERVSTAMGRYVAVPHGSKDLVLKPSLVIVNLKTPILWDDEFRVDLIFILAVNFNKVQINKYFFSKLYEIIKNEELISAIKKSDDISEIEQLFL